MRFELRQTGGGKTVFDQEAGECFKSRHSAKAETECVFYQPGVEENPWVRKASPFRVLELGFGLGTNFLHLSEKTRPLELVSVDRDLSGARFFLEQEPSPLLEEILGTGKHVSPFFRADLLTGDFFDVLPGLLSQGQRFHCVYFDPFSPAANPEAWTTELFRLSYDLLLPEGRLVTYSVSRAAKDAARAAGFLVEKRDLPPSLQKRSSLLASKPGVDLE